jgi:hypothetical protein
MIIGMRAARPFTADFWLARAQSGIETFGCKSAFSWHGVPFPASAVCRSRPRSSPLLQRGCESAVDSKRTSEVSAPEND